MLKILLSITREIILPSESVQDQKFRTEKHTDLQQQGGLGAVVARRVHGEETRASTAARMWQHSIHGTMTNYMYGKE